MTINIAINMTISMMRKKVIEWILLLDSSFPNHISRNILFMSIQVLDFFLRNLKPSE